MTVEKVKFVTVTRVIDPKSGIHYLDSVDSEGFHWMAQMVHNINSDEPYLLYKKVWYKDPQMPYDI
jgi:hypothetical protein